MKGFFHFIRQQGVVGLAIGFILGGTINGVVKSLVDDIIQPLIGMIFGSTTSLANWTIGSIRLGNFLSLVINFIVIAAVVYFIFKGLKLDKLDLPKEDPTKPVDKAPGTK